TVELQCVAPDHLALRTSPSVTLAQLVKSALRTSPTRIVVGEVRGSEALDLLDAWATGHPGGVATVHASSPAGALRRLDRPAAPAVPRHTPPCLPPRPAVGAALALASVLLPHVAVAASAGGGAPMPWTGPLQSLLNNLSGPTARIIGALAFVVGGALWAFTRHEEGARRFAQAVVGVAIMIGAANIVSALAFVGATV